MFPAPLSVIRDDPTPIDVNCTEGVQWIWTVFRECAVTSKEITAVSFGLISAFIWVVFAFPQIIENCRKGIPDQALSPIMLFCFILGDTVIMAAIGVTSDLIQISQFLYYMFMHKRTLQNVASLTEVTSSGDSDDTAQVRTRSSATIVLCLTLGVICFFSPTLPTFETNVIPTISYSSSSVLTRKLLQSAVTVTTPMPIPEPLFPASMHYFAEWSFLTPALDQIVFTFVKEFRQRGKAESLKSRSLTTYRRHWRRGSTEGLSPITFIFAICGNISYALQLLLTSLDRVFIIRSLPWIFGSINCVLLDLTKFGANLAKNSDKVFPPPPPPLPKQITIRFTKFLLCDIQTSGFGRASAHKCASFDGDHILLFKKNLLSNQPSIKFDLSFLHSLILESHINTYVKIESQFCSAFGSFSKISDVWHRLSNILVDSARTQMNRISRADNRSRMAAEKQLAERFLKADRRTRSTLLAVIPANLSNKVVCITLVNDTKVTGTLKGIDGFSNVILGGSVRIDPPSYKKNALPLVGLRHANILGKRIRYIGLPENTNVKKSIREYLEATRDRTHSKKRQQHQGRGRGDGSLSRSRLGGNSRPTSRGRPESRGR
ncbi:hypothetical protein ACTXT7_014595 [Hymenolepis weldensis]